jgi:hypothetical protein
MTIEYQLDLLRYMVQDRGVKKLLKEIEPNVFDLEEHQVILELLQQYVEQFKVLPKKTSFKEFINEAISGKEWDEDIIKIIFNTVNKSYESVDSDIPMMRASIIKFAKRKMVMKMFAQYAPIIHQTDDSDFMSIQSKMRQIISLGDDQLGLPEGKYIFKDYTSNRQTVSQGYPTQFKRLNAMTAINGFISPELIIFLASPKGFKTGTILSIATHYAAAYNLKVLYCDTENGVQAITDRAYQKLSGTTHWELIQGDADDELKEKSKLISKMGGEIRVEYFPAVVSTLYDVENKLAELAEEGFMPDVIVYDYFDKFGPSSKKIFDKRLQIQSVYDHALRINVKHNTFALSVSQANRSAIGQAVVDMSHFAEDIGKAANAHAAFAICRTQWELDNGYGHIIPVVQRRGRRYFPGEECFVKIDEERMQMTEVTQDEADMIREQIGIMDDEVQEDRRVEIGDVSDD